MKKIISIFSVFVFVAIFSFVNTPKAEAFFNWGANLNLGFMGGNNYGYNYYDYGYNQPYGSYGYGYGNPYAYDMYSYPSYGYNSYDYGYYNNYTSGPYQMYYQDRMTTSKYMY